MQLAERRPLVCYLGAIRGELIRWESGFPIGVRALELFLKFVRLQSRLV